MSIPTTFAMLKPPEWVEFGAILPGSIACLAVLALILLNASHKGSETSRDYYAYVTAVAMAATVGVCWLLWDDTVARPVFHGMLYFDKFTLLFGGLFAVSAGLAALTSPRYLKVHDMGRAEYYLLIMTSVSGMAFLSGVADMMSFFVAFEVMSIPVYCIAGFLRRDSRGAEAAMKYFVLGAFSSALMLYGIALLYGLTGSTSFEFIGRRLAELMVADGGGVGTGMMMLALLMILAGFAFKVASVPFHLWTPDVYTGSPTPAVGFMATAVKASAFAPMIRIFTSAFGHVGQTAAGQMLSLRGGFYGYGWVDVFIFVAAASMILGNLVAITQDNVKRMLAYSTIAHAGYILVGFVAAGARPEFFLKNDAVIFYLIAYTFGTVGAFGVLAYFERRNDPAETYEDLNGLGFEYPAVGLMMGIFMFSSAGIPPTGGFVGKLYVFKSAVDVGSATGEATFIGLAVLGVLTSVAGVYYYLRVLVHMYMEPFDGEREDFDQPAARFALIVAGVATLYLGVLPGKAVDLSRAAVTDFAGAPPAVQETIDRAEERRASQQDEGSESGR